MKTYKISEFARLAGVTSRTLQYYDHAALLSPSLRTEKGYRLYTRGDLLRLQQLRTLNWMGFTLKEAAHILDDQETHLKTLLHQQRIAFERERNQIDEAIKAIDHMLKLSEGQNQENIQPDAIQSVLKAVTKHRSREWIKQYSTSTEWENFGQQAEKVRTDAPSYFLIIEALEDAYSTKKDPTSKEVQALIGEMSFLAGEMKKKATMSDGIRAAMKEAYDNRSSMPPFMGLGEGFTTFMQEAMIHYGQQSRPTPE